MTAINVHGFPNLEERAPHILVYQNCAWSREIFTCLRYPNRHLPPLLGPVSINLQPPEYHLEGKSTNSRSYRDRFNLIQATLNRKSWKLTWFSLAPFFWFSKSLHWYGKTNRTISSYFDTAARFLSLLILRGTCSWTKWSSSLTNPTLSNFLAFPDIFVFPLICIGLLILRSCCLCFRQSSALFSLEI